VTPALVRVTSVTVTGPTGLRVVFTDGRRGDIDVSPLLDDGPVFGPLRSAGYFSRVELDPVAGTVVWPNGADFAPEALHALLPATAGVG
jgi:Protein of unknown function (DUF2442)